MPPLRTLFNSERDIPRQPEPAYLATLFDQPLARAVPPPERWVDHTAAGSAAVLPMLSFQVTECWTDPEAWVAS